MAAEKPKDAQLFEKYLEGKKILIADTGAANRSSLYKIFQDLGAKPQQLVMVNNFKQAEGQIQQIKPHIVIAEYDLGRRCGLDLLQAQRTQNPEETKQMIFVVVTGNTSQSAVARAAEEDIDAYILKPYTLETVRQILLKAAIAKINPPQYRLTIEKGKELLAEGNFDGAEEQFRNATSLDPTPSLAFYYIGQTKFLKKVLSDAKGNYNKGLEFNKIHYKCMIGLYELMMNQKQHEQAYEVVKRVSQYFPANPKRLTEVLRLAIINGKYEDVEKYYAVFVNIDEREETLIKYICAALVVCGKYYLGIKAKTRALELFQKAAATGYGRSKILKEIVQVLVDFNMAKEAKIYLEKFPFDARKSAEYLLMDFLVLDMTSHPGVTIDVGRKLITQGIFDERLYSVLIQRHYDAKLNSAADDLIYDAIKKFPKHKEIFEKMRLAS